MDLPVTWKTAAYKALKYSNDLNAVRRGRVPRRIVRRGLGRSFGRAMRKMLG